MVPPQPAIGHPLDLSQRGISAGELQSVLKSLPTPHQKPPKHTYFNPLQNNKMRGCDRKKNFETEDNYKIYSILVLDIILVTWWEIENASK